MRSRSRKRGWGSTVLAVLFRILLLCGLLFLLWQAFGEKLFGRWLPSTEHKDLTEWFEVEGDEVRLYLDGQMEDEYTGLYRFDHVYLPYEYVQEKVNPRFFLNSDGTVSMTLPEDAQLFDSHSYEGSAPVLLQESGSLYLLLDTVKQYTSLTDDSFTSESDGPYRVFLHTGGSPGQETKVRRKAALRTRMSRTAPVLEEMKPDERVVVFDQTEEWGRVLTGSGIIGYIPVRDLGEITDFTWPDTWTFPEAEHTLLPEKVVLGWHSLVGTAANEYFESLYLNTGGALNVVSPTWIQIRDADGNYTNYAGEAYVAKAHEAGVQVWAAVDNFNEPAARTDFSTRACFGDREKRADFIRRLMEDAGTFGFDGINLDFEGVPADAGPAYVQMIRELSNACRNAGLVLSVDNYVPYAYNSHYELSEQALYADYVIIMGYDEHTGENVGSVSSQPWLEDGIRRALAQVPKEQLIGAVPFYTRRWEITNSGTTSTALGMSEADRYVAEQGIPLSWDETSGQFYGELVQGAMTQKIWMEDEQSLTLKSDFLKSEELGGIAAWRLGYEPSEIWKILDWNSKWKETGADTPEPGEEEPEA